MQFSTFMALAVATGTHFALAEEANHGPVIYPGRNNTGVPFNGSHPIFPTGSGRPSGIISTGKPTLTTRPITKPVTLSTSTCTDEEGVPTSTSTLSFTLSGDPVTAFPPGNTHTPSNTPTDTVGDDLPTVSVSLPSGINTQIASSNDGAFTTLSTLPGLSTYAAETSTAPVYGKPSSAASSLGSESSLGAPVYGTPIIPSGNPTNKPFPLPSGGFPTHPVNNTIPLPSGTGRPRPISSGASSRTAGIPTGTGVSIQSTNTPPVYGKPKPTLPVYNAKRAESEVEEEDCTTTSAHGPKGTGINTSGMAHHSGFVRPSGVAFPSGGPQHPSGIAHPSNSRTKSFETRTKTKSAGATGTKTNEPEMTIY